MEISTRDVSLDKEVSIKCLHAYRSALSEVCAMRVLLSFLVFVCVPYLLLLYCRVVRIYNSEKNDLWLVR